MKLCTSIAPTSMRQAIHEAKLVKTKLAEIRTDGIKDLKMEKLLRATKKTIIITNRRKAEGGKFSGTWAKQFKILSEAINHGADYIDVELYWGKSQISRLKSLSGKTKLIVSYHNLRETPNNLSSIYKKMRSTRADVIKIVTTANDISDNKRIFDLTERAHRNRQKTIALCMGERGQISRILSGKYGGFLSFASKTPEQITAPGQLTNDQLQSLFRADRINQQTNVFGLIGNPVSYSQGIFFHNRIFKEQKQNAVYVNFLVDDQERFMKAFGRGYSGFSVTMPFKQAIVPLLDFVEEEASELGMVNTIINNKGKLIGSNTDFPAIVSLLKKNIQLQNKQVLVLGTGATSTTMAYAGIRNGAQVTIAGRSLSKAKLLADKLSCRYITLNDIPKTRADVIMNGTSVGMESNESLIPKKYFKKGMVVLDAVYSSEFTPLLRNAKRAGCKVVSGMELFLQQAKLQSTLFLESMK